MTFGEGRGVDRVEILAEGVWVRGVGVVDRVDIRSDGRVVTDRVFVCGRSVISGLFRLSVGAWVRVVILPSTLDRVLTFFPALSNVRFGRDVTDRDVVSGTPRVVRSVPARVVRPVLEGVGRVFILFIVPLLSRTSRLVNVRIVLIRVIRSDGFSVRLS